MLGALDPVPAPSAQSLAHRARLASLVSPLRRIRPRVPFWELAAHRIPTLWHLYRGLLRHAPSENLRWRIRELFMKHRHVTSPAVAKEKLLEGYERLDRFMKAQQGDEKVQTLLRRQDRRLACRREKEDWNRIHLKTLVEYKKECALRPLLTGAFFRPTFYNGPLPRMKPQPEHISMMIRKRRRARERRMEKNLDLNIVERDLVLEADFERRLLQKGAKFQSVFADHLNMWLYPAKSTRREIIKTFERDKQRSETPFSAEVVEKIIAARRRKIAAYTDKIERERRGEILPRTLRRLCQAPPAHILATMSPERRRMDRVSREASEGGYVGMVKKKLGFKLKNPDLHLLEDGEEHEREHLDARAAQLEAIQEQRETEALKKE